jgi:hypothetical protein
MARERGTDVRIVAAEACGAVFGQRESAVGRRIAALQPVPVCPKTAPHAYATAAQEVCPRLLGIEECPH